MSGTDWTDDGERIERDDGDQGADGGSGDGGYDPVAAARRDREVIAEAARLVDAERGRLLHEYNLGESSLEGEEVVAAVRAGAGARRLSQIADAMLSRGAGQGPELATAATATVGVVKGDVKSARKRWPSAVWDKVWDEIKAISRRLWSMVAHLVKVKEWTVQGQAGTGILGLASASVSVTFGS